MTLQRIAYVLKIFPKLSETFIAGELAELRRRGIDLKILSLLPPREQLQHEMVARAGLGQLTAYEAKEFSAILRRFRPQLLHAHFATESTAMARELAAEHNIPFTFTAHGYDIHRKPPADLRERAAAAAAVITVSQANARYMTETYGIPADHIRVLPSGVDTDRFRPANDGCPQTDRLIVCVARQVQVKNLGLLLQACAVLRDRGVNFHCVMAGDGPLRSELAAQQAQLGLGEIVEMPGALEQAQVLKLWQRASVGVLSSDNEGMPVSLLEAAACGVPIVATAVGGVPELIEDGVSGALVQPGDPGALADALQSLLSDESTRTRLGNAARRRVEERFSLVRQVDDLLTLWSEVLGRAPAPPGSTTDRVHDLRRQGAATKVIVTDPFGAALDAEMPTLAAALSAEPVARKFKRGFPRLTTAGVVVPRFIRVIRHKPGRRCLVEYDVRIEEKGKPRRKTTLIGKVRARRSGNEGYRLQEALWKAGFRKRCADGISVPEPIGVIPGFRMWFQRKVRGSTATELLAGADGVRLASRIADAIHKLHRANVSPKRKHEIVDELRILRECLDKVMASQPELSQRLENIWNECQKLAASIPKPQACGIHRDFYPAQVIVDGARLYLIDFDCYCLGDPALDAGNFLGHVTEQSLRQFGSPDALAEAEHSFAERFIELSGEPCRQSVRAYALLTLVRHIYLSTQFAERLPHTRALLELCEQRLYCARTR